MKLCYVVTVPGTIKAFFVPQIKFLASKGINVSVICSYDKELQELLGDSINYIPVNMPRGIAFYESIKAIKHLTEVFRQEEFDLIQYSTPNASLYASIASKIAGITRRNYHLMGYRYAALTGVKRLILKKIEKISCNNSTTIECVSNSNLEYGVSEGLFPREKAIVVWNGSTGGIDLNRFDYRKRACYKKEIRDKLGFSECDFIFGYVGRITKDKGIDELLEAYLSLGNSSKLLIVGDFESKYRLRQDLLAKAYRNDSIVFHERVRDVEKYFAAIDILVLPSYREGFGNVIIEAAAMGTPAIVTDIPGPIDAIIEGESAIVVKPKDGKDLAEAMDTITERKLIELSQSAIHFARNNFDSEVLNSKILERKRELLDRG